MATVQEKARKLVGEAYYGDNAAIGDGKFLEMLLAFLSSFLGGCPLGARRAHNMINGGVFMRRRARNQLEYAAYEWTGGDWEQTQKIVDAGMAAGKLATADDFQEFAS